ncbi:alpha 1,2-mannosyltransferase [Metschnikowia aff. pulcherrima]|uniref:Alpha 1,2-mannosyltransferase n=1 Tax=Metschnikowia aff. pulcherrima TaxID=2163413 RepID=A0A4P6XRC6_9ASCO|nr:alpha 1,2-mannosyltransferase [Metschnikowia aff. pulcherrima]
MRFLKNVAIRLRLQRRRHRNVSIAAAMLLTVVVFSLFYIWQDYATEEFHYVMDPTKGCRFLPSFLCNWGLPSEADDDDQPYNPLLSSTAKVGDSGKTKPKNAKDFAQKGQQEDSESPLTQAEIAKLEQILTHSQTLDAKRLALGHEFYKDILKDIINAKPKIENKLERYLNGAKCNSERYEDGKTDPFFSEEYLSSFLQLDETELSALTASHKYIMDHLPESAPAGLYKGDGIVFVGGGKFNWLTLLSIRGLRGNGCELPVEILIPALNEYDLELCTKIFPAMNAQCIYLPTALYGDDLEFASRLSFKGYQYKSLAILLSSFENVLLMDSDNMAAYSPEHLFQNEPFLSRGLVVWPDYWRRSTSPSFYKIAGQEVSENELIPRYSEHFGYYQQQSLTAKFNAFKEVPYHERKGAIPDPSSESGQLMISKKTHLKAILLALYYNTYGPKFYYPIFSQGAQGEGDKETFLAATVVLKKPFYQVGKFLNSLGNVKNGVYTGHAMGQFDPVIDYKLSLEKKELATRFKDKDLQTELEKMGDPKMLFLHANFPKLDPWALREAGETLDKDGRHRLYGWSLKWRTGTDLEVDIWNHMNTILCEARLEIDHFKNINRNYLCAEIKAQMKHLEKTANRME